MVLPRALWWSSHFWIWCTVVIAVPAFADQQGSTGDKGQVQERGIQPYTCSPDSGVCLCIGQANCDQLTQPKPCKRPKLCLAQPPPPTGQELQLIRPRGLTDFFPVCSCRAQ